MTVPYALKCSVTCLYFLQLLSGASKHVDDEQPLLEEEYPDDFEEPLSVSEEEAVSDTEGLISDPVEPSAAKSKESDEDDI